VADDLLSLLRLVEPSREVAAAVDEMFARDAPAMSVEARQRLVAAARRGLQYRADRIQMFRILLFEVMQAWWLDQAPEWAAFWIPVAPPWVGPYELGDEP
jgi:hypothetical protein